MAYCSAADVQHMMGGLSRLNASADWDKDGNADTTVVDTAIAIADALINSYASKRYLVPFNPVTEQIRWMSARLARWQLRDPRAMPTEHEMIVYNNDIAWLVSLSKGEVTPGTDPLPPKSSMVVDAATPRPTSKDVSRSKLKGFA